MFDNDFFDRARKWWNEYGYEAMIVVCLLFIFVGSFFQKGKGTWSNSFVIPREVLQKNKTEGVGERESTGERECRRVLQSLFNRPFLKVRPNFLNNPVTGGDYNLELDCFCEPLKLAVEYNGVQHYKYTPYFHKNKEAFLNQKYRDEIKRRSCADNGITLIEVPYTVKPQDIAQYLVDELRDKGFVK